jgi:peptidoglycan hydrolase-like protein with peptidoglycan-binding domain
MNWNISRTGLLVAIATGLLLFGSVARADFTRGYQAWDLGDYVTARKYLGAAAKRGDLDAQNHLGQMEEDGQGGAVNLKQAVSWYRKAATAGHPAAQLNLGRMYRSGKGVRQDDTLAVSWYRKAAEQGLSIAQFFMGLMYDTGKGVPSDYVQSYKWFDLATRQGDEDARYKRDRLAKQMTPSQIMQAERLAAAFLGEELGAPSSRTQQGGRELLASQTQRKPLQVALAKPAAVRDLAKPIATSATPAGAGPALSGKPLTELQRLLNYLGYNAGTPTGKVNAATIKAAQRFRSDTDQVASQSLDRPLLLELRRVRAQLPQRRPRPADAKALVKRIQTALNALGYDAGSSDGLIGSKTIASARRYRSDLGYKVRDELTAGLLRVTETRLAVISRGSRRMAAPVAAPVKAEATPALQVVRSAPNAPAPKGRELVLRLQQALSDLGYKPGPVDGAIGKKTRAAITQYQRREQLKADGRATASLLARLERKEASTSRAGPRLRFVRPSSQRELVRRAQVRLNSLGYYFGSPDGLPGSKTMASLKAFQARARLSADGLLTEELLQQLEDAAAPRPASRKRSLNGAQLVREIQRELNRLGYPAGTADGIIGRRTVNAARAFQRDLGIAENGTLSPGLLQALRTAQ